jgi:hypothetical protein
MLLIFGFLLQTVGKLVIFVNYQINKEAITAAYCENKSKPQMHCNGKCHLAKQLKNADADESKNRSSKTNLQEVFNLFSIRLSSLNISLPVTGTDSWFSYSDNYSFDFSSSLVHPPTV